MSWREDMDADSWAAWDEAEALRDDGDSRMPSVPARPAQDDEDES